MCLLLICIVNLCVFGELFCPKNELSLPRSWAVGLQVRMNACRLVILLTWDLLHVRKWRLHVQNDFNSFSKTPVQNYLIQSAFQRSFWVWQNIEGKDRFLTNYLAGLETDNWLSLQQEPTARIFASGKLLSIHKTILTALTWEKMSPLHTCIIYLSRFATFWPILRG